MVVVMVGMVVETESRQILLLRRLLHLQLLDAWIQRRGLGTRVLMMTPLAFEDTVVSMSGRLLVRVLVASTLISLDRMVDCRRGHG